jgi:crotonobetainyl-CoA:carnitine CoA-transferase CaiB-like acyl-CoA transferase
MIDDPRFADGAGRYTNSKECIEIIDEVFASKTFTEWKEALATLQGVWAPGQMPSELADDPQVGANGYLATVERADGNSYDLVANPVQMNETPDPLTAAPEHGQHTEEILLELGLDWDQIIAHKEAGAIL